MLPLRFCGLLSFMTLVAAACGSSGGAPAAPVPTPNPVEGPPVLTITSSGVTPQVLHSFDYRETITFMNADAQPHDMRSDPHPVHAGCGSLNIGPIMPGESRQIAGPTLPHFTLCYFHDEADPANNRYRGVLITH